MFYLIDKPLGVTSFDVIRALRKNLQIKKMGHSGTLDPLASGCLLIATENSTKLLPLLESAAKEYIFTIRLDGRSDSLDMGTPISPIDTSWMLEKTNKEIQEFILSQKTQIPPQYSALHIDGERAYDLARKGKIFDIPKREIQVEEVEILEKNMYDITLRIIISSWGYVRSFAPLLWEYLGVPGWYISSLRRTSIRTAYWVLGIDMSCSIENISSISYGKLFHTIPTIEISDEVVQKLREWRLVEVLPSKKYSDNSLLFLENSATQYISLCRCTQGICTIIRNGV